MSELAYDLNGEPITLPASAQWWKVRRFRNPGMRGAPEMVIDRDGSPLLISVDTSFVEFRDQVDGTAGRYRLDPLDERRKVVADIPAAYVTLTDGPRAAGSASASADDRDLVIRELVRAQADMVKTMSERFSHVMQAAAELLRAADGAGLPARPPMALDARAIETDEEEDDEESEDGPAPVAAAPMGFDINALVAQVVPVVVMNLMNGKLDLSKLGSLFDWRKAAANAKGADVGASHASAGGEQGEASKRAATTPAQPAAAARPHDHAADAMPPLDPAAMAHFIAVQSALTPAEAALAREVAKDLSPAELRGWFTELSAMSVPDAVAKIRTMIGGSNAQTTKEGGAS